MKKIILVIIFFLLLCFTIPILFTKHLEKKEVALILENSIENSLENEIIQEQVKNYDYKKYTKIKVLHTKTNLVEEMDLDTYLYGVVSAEMPAAFEKEALKAQAIVARTYTIYKIENVSSQNKHGEAQICDDSTCCQAWISKEDRFARWQEQDRENNWAKIVEAVDSTKGKMITYEGRAINAFFHSNSGGKTETTINVWGGDGYPYLQAVSTSGEEQYSQYASEYICSKEEFIQKVKQKHADFSIDFAQEDCIKVLEYTEGERVKNIKIGNLQLSGVEIRTIFGLKSANFTIAVEGDNIKFGVKGYGHGVGMSQTGADSMAKQGSNYEEIIKHFYTGVEIVDI